MLHARGDVSIFRSGFKLPTRVCSTHVEMFLGSSKKHRKEHGMLHARGDVSSVYDFTADMPEYALRTWRCFCHSTGRGSLYGVCSTHVEMFPTRHMTRIHSAGMLHARGDVSMRLWIDRHILVYAPRTWRCFYRVLCLRVR